MPVLTELTLLTKLSALTAQRVNSVNLVPLTTLMPELFDKHGGFRKLHTSTLAIVVQLETLHFCRRFLTFDHRETGNKFYDPKGRQSNLPGILWKALDFRQAASTVCRTSARVGAVEGAADVTGNSFRRQGGNGLRCGAQRTGGQPRGNLRPPDGPQ